MTRKISVLFLPVLLLALSGCSWFSKDEVDPIFENLPTGPDSRQLLRQLPDGLPGDTDNSRHLNTSNAPPELSPDKDG